MDYKKIYKNLCERGKNRTKTRNSNLENHHIIPTFFYKGSKRKHRYNDGIFEGDGEHIGNITVLTPREHFIAHLLLCKIMKNTKWEYRCYLSLKMFLNDGQVNEKRKVFDYSSRVYEKYKILTNKNISNGKKGTMPVKDAMTGERLGVVSLNHPKVVSGEWVHITKGIKKSEQIIEKQREKSTGFNNSNSKYTDEQIFESFKKCCYHYKKLVNQSLWVEYSMHHNLPYLKFFKEFRFNGLGQNGMRQKLLEQAKKDKIDIEIITNYNSYEWKQFTSKEIKKWV